MQAVGRAIAKVLGLIDEIVTLLLLAAGIALTVVLALDGASIVQVGLVLILSAVVAGVWAYTSNAWEWFQRSE
jgi:hypothetical protein